MNSITPNYKCLKSQEFNSHDYKLVPLRHQDIQLIKDWRNAQMIILRQNKEISESDQEAYYQNVVVKSFQKLEPDLILFSLLYQNKCIGYGGLVWINWPLRQAEVSFLVDPERTAEEIYKKDFSAFLKLIRLVAFQDLHFQQIYTETYETRAFHMSILESQGFILCKKLENRITKDGKVLNAFIHRCKRSYE